MEEEKLAPPRTGEPEPAAEESVRSDEAAGGPSTRRPVVPGPVYQVIGEILAFTSQVDEAWLGEPATAAPAEAVEQDGES